MITFEPAVRTQSYARIALVGPPGSGKTYTALTLAFGLGRRVAVIDTDRGSASKYAGVNGWEFDRCNVTSYAPNSLVDILAAAAGAGYDAIVLDTWSHYWDGVDGMLEQVDRRKRGGSSSSGWTEVRPEERRMIEALLAFPGHVIVTLRSRIEYVLDEDDRGRTHSRRVGMKPVQRDGIDYEFDIVGDLDADNTLTVSKSRFPLLAHEVIRRPGVEVADLVLEWLADGEARPTATEYRDRALAPDATSSGLIALFREIERDLMLAAPVIDGDGRPTVLGELVATRGRFLRDREQTTGRPE